MTEKKYIILTDIKEFTYKNTLLTSNQVEQLLAQFDAIVMQSAEKHGISIIKSIGDAYLAMGDDAQKAYDFTKEIIELTQKYDTTQKIDIKKISLRAAITYGEISKNRSMNLDDYFGECINLASRIMDITPAGMIFTSSLYVKQLGVGQKSKSLGKYSFHGVLSKTEIFSLTQISQEEIESLNSDSETLLQECEDIVFKSACVSAILSAQPIPFVESFNVVGVHLYMILKLSQKLERGVSLRSGSKIFSDVVSPLGVGYFTSQGMNTIAKILLPGIGGYLFSPISFAVSYAMGKVYTAYFFYEMGGEKLTNSDITGIFAKQRQVGQDLAKREKKHIFKTGKQFYTDVLGIKEKTGYSQVQKDLISMLKRNTTQKK